MNRMLRAEWYRLKGNHRIFVWSFGFIALFFYIGLYESEALYTPIPATFAFYTMMSLITGMMLYLTIAISCLLVFSYENKTLHYDMMAGNKISGIIISKVIISASIYTLYLDICMIGFSAYFAQRNGVGDMKILISYILLYTAVNFRIISCCLLITTIFKGVVGIAVVFVRFGVLDILPSMILQELAEDNEKYTSWLRIFTANQYTFANGEALSAGQVSAVIITMVVEILIWYVLSYISHKKKLFY